MAKSIERLMEVQHMATKLLRSKEEDQPIAREARI